MTPWEALTDPDYKAFLQSRGWTESEWNKTEPWERGAERVEFKGGLQDTSVLKLLPGAIKETVSEQAAAVGGAVKAAAGFARRTVLTVVFIVGAVALIVYRPQLIKLMGKGK